VKLHPENIPEAEADRTPYGCPVCKENRIDLLLITEDDQGDVVDCLVCGGTYRP